MNMNSVLTDRKDEENLTQKEIRDNMEMDQINKDNE